MVVVRSAIAAQHQVDFDPSVKDTMQWIGLN